MLPGVKSVPTQKCEAQLLFAANMKRIRLANSLTQERLAEYAGLHANYISSVERGERNLSVCNIQRIARGLGTSMAELLTEPSLPAMGGKGAKDVMPAELETVLGDKVDEDCAADELSSRPLLPAMGGKKAKNT